MDDIIYIAGSITAGYPLPPHFQLKPVADDENKRIQRSFVDSAPIYVAFIVLTEWFLMALLLIAIKLLEWTQQSLGNI